MSFLGVKSVKFFGFECTNSSFKITDERKQQIQQIRRPMTKKGMQSLLGTTVICSKFIPNYSVRVQNLYSMTTMDYNWTTCWNPIEIAAFDDLKQAVLDCCALHYPDATKYLVLETDASNTGWGYVLYRFDTKDYIIEPIMLGGAKFSDPATRWPTIEAECYSVYGSAKAVEPYLLARPFFLHNDHQNLDCSHDCTHLNLSSVLHHALASCFRSTVRWWRFHVPNAPVLQACFNQSPHRINT